MSGLRFVDQEDFVSVAEADAHSILLTRFTPALDVPGVQSLVAEISSQLIDIKGVDVREVTYDPSVSDSTAMSLDRLEAHTDGAFLVKPPPRFILSCRRADPGDGGLSTFISVDDIVEVAPDWAIEGLCSADFRFLKTYDGDLATSFVGPVLSRSDDGRWLIRWRADHIQVPEVVDEHGTRGRDAVTWLHDLVRTRLPERHRLDVGELALIPNGRFLHGRTALSADSRRSILRAWVF